MKRTIEIEIINILSDDADAVTIISSHNISPSAANAMKTEYRIRIVEK